MQISAIRQIAESQGGFATLLKKGDATAGALYIILSIRGVDTAIYQREYNPAFELEWAEKTFDFSDSQNLNVYLEKIKLRDPDLWIIEVDIADKARFTASLSAMG